MTGIALQIALSIVLDNPGNYNRLDDRTIWTILFHIKDNFYSASVIIADILSIFSYPATLHTHTWLADRVCERCRYDGSRIKSPYLSVIYSDIRLTDHWVMRIERQNSSRIDSRFG